MTKRSKQPTPAEIRRVFRSLPRTADGRVPHCGMKVYEWDYARMEIREWSVEGFIYPDTFVVEDPDYTGEVVASDLFALRTNAVREAKRRKGAVK